MSAVLALALAQQVLALPQVLVLALPQVLAQQVLVLAQQVLVLAQQVLVLAQAHCQGSSDRRDRTCSGWSSD